MMLVGFSSSSPLRNRKSCLVILVIITLVYCCILYSKKDVFFMNRMERQFYDSSKAHRSPGDKDAVVTLSQSLSNGTFTTEPVQLRFFNSSKAFDERYIPFLEELGLIGYGDFVNLSQPLPNVTFITAISENHAGEGRSLIKRLAKDHPDWKIYIYDLGLKEESRRFFEKACNVAGVRDIDLVHFGVVEETFIWKFFGIGLKNYRWKPIVIAKALKEFPVILWMDSSTFFASNMTMPALLDRINITDGQGPNYYLLRRAPHSIYAATSPGMYDYLAPQSNIYREIYQTNCLIVRTKATVDLALKWLVLCALEGACMAPKGSQLACSFAQEKDKHNNTYANCHRYDMSAINLILLPYPRSLLGSWTEKYIWTEREVTADEGDISCR